MTALLWIISIMASKKEINKQNLINLGIEQLAEILLEISGKDAIVKRILKTAIAGSLGEAEATKEIRKSKSTTRSLLSLWVSVTLIHAVQYAHTFIHSISSLIS